MAVAAVWRQSRHSAAGSLDVAQRAARRDRALAETGRGWQGVHRELPLLELRPQRTLRRRAAAPSDWRHACAALGSGRRDPLPARRAGSLRLLPAFRGAALARKYAGGSRQPTQSETTEWFPTSFERQNNKIMHTYPPRLTTKLATSIGLCTHVERNSKPTCQAYTARYEFWHK